MSRVEALAWPAARVQEAVHALAKRSQLCARDFDRAAPPSAASEHTPALERYAQQLGLELEQAALTPGRLGARARALAPAIVYARRDAGQRFYALLAGHGAHVALLAPDGARVTVLVRELCHAIWGDTADEPAQAAEQLLASLLPSPKLRARARRRLLEQHHDPTRACRAWLLHAAPAASLVAWLRGYGLVPRAVRLLGLHAAQYALGLLAFWTVGHAVLADRIDPGVFGAFALLSISVVPLHLWEGAALAELSLRLSALFKQRAFGAALASDHDALRRRGVGEHFGHVLDCDAFENLAVTGALSGALALIELVVAALILGAAAGPWLVLALTLWVALLCALCLRYLAGARDFATTRLSLTHAVVERMLAHRTRLVQEPREHWHAGEDALLESYLLSGRDHDRHTAQLLAFGGRGFLSLAILLLTPAWLASPRPSSALIAAGLAGALLAYRALSRLANSLAALCDAKLAYERLSTIRNPQKAPRAQVVPAAFEPLATAGPGELVLRAQDLSYRPNLRAEHVLRHCSLQLQHGERLLLTGGSGSGKSTLVSVLAGLRLPASGTLLLRGLDLRSLGLDGWRKGVALAPQFHDNHVLSGTLAFNLLLGRSWPPSASDLAEAEALCVELGLADLLDRMPARLQQQLGETGWQLSHGERSRLFLARALLAQAEIVLLDESFAALDPMTLETSMNGALRHAPTLVVVAHP